MRLSSSCIDRLLKKKLKKVTNWANYFFECYQSPRRSWLNISMNCVYTPPSEVKPSPILCGSFYHPFILCTIFSTPQYYPLYILPCQLCSLSFQNKQLFLSILYHHHFFIIIFLFEHENLVDFFFPNYG